MWVRAFFNSYKRRVIAAGGVIQNEPCAVRSLNNNLLRSASWTLVPSGIEEDIVFAQKPTSGLGDLTFTRASDATYTDAGGVVRRSPYNLLTFSEQFNDASWTKTALTISTSATANPVNGALTAQDAIPTAVSSAHRIFKLAGAESIANTWSIFAKAKGYNFITIVENGNTSASVSFNLSTGAVSTQISAVGQIQSLGNGWYRCSMVHTTALSPRFDVYISPTDSIAAYTGDGTSGVTLFGAQAVQGTSALDYFPTTNRQDVPRIDFRNADGTLSSCGRLLLEPQRTNRVLYSEQFDNAAWVKSVATVTANTTISPDGSQNADTIAFTASAIAFCQQIVAGAFESQSHTVSVYAKVASGTATFRLKCTHGGVTDYFSSDFTATTTWQRFTFTATFGATIGTSIVCGVINGTNALAKNVIFYGFQTEANASYATTYIPTTTAAVTRLADAASKTGVSSLIGQTEGTVFFDANFDDNNTVNFSISDGTSSNYILIDTTSLRAVGLIIQQGGVTQAQLTTANSFYTSGTRLKCAIAYKQNDFAFYINGTLIGTDSSGTVPACDQIRFSRWNGALPAAQGIAQSALFKTRLTNAQLAQLTTL
jgi:hypothetical protein